MWPWPEGRLWIIAGAIMQLLFCFTFAFPTFVAASLPIILNTSQSILLGILADAFAMAASPQEVREVREKMFMYNVTNSFVGPIVREVPIAKLLASEFVSNWVVGYGEM